MSVVRLEICHGAGEIWDWCDGMNNESILEEKGEK